MPWIIGSLLDDFNRERIVRQFKDGKSERDSSTTLNMSLSTVNRIICRFKRDEKTNVSPR